jgi:hypothetical protein
VQKAPGVLNAAFLGIRPGHRKHAIQAQWHQHIIAVELCQIGWLSGEQAVAVNFTGADSLQKGLRRTHEMSIKLELGKTAALGVAIAVAYSTRPLSLSDQ